MSRWFSLALLVLSACASPAAPRRMGPVAAPSLTTLAPAPVAAPPVADRSVAVVVTDGEHGDAVYQVHATGAAERIWPPRDAPPITWSHSTLAGSDVMRPSRDARRIAFVQDDVISIHDRTQGTTVEVARAPKPARGRRARAAAPVALITDWSPDGTELLYAFSTGGEPSVDHFFRYDLARATSTPVAMPGEYAGWLATGELLVRHGELRAVSASGASRSLTPGFQADMQLALDSDRTHAATFMPLDESFSRTQLIAIDTRTAARQPLAPPQSPADLQWPRWSPSGTKIACLASDRLPNGHVLQALWVDGRRIGEASEDLSAHAWIDDDTIVLVHEKSLVVVSLPTGAVKGRTTVP